MNLQESWAICRIFKKTNNTAQRALSHSWVSTLPETRSSAILTKDQDNNTHFCSTNMPLTKKTSLATQFCTNNYNDAQPLTTNTTSSTTLCPLDVASYKSIINPLLYKAFDHLPPISNGDLSTSLLFSPPFETSDTNFKSTIDVSSMLMNMSSSVLGDFNNKTSEDTNTNTITNFGELQEHYSGFPIPFLREVQTTFGNQQQYDSNINASVKVPNVNVPRVNEQELEELETVRTIGFPFSSIPYNIGDAWKSNLLWDTSSFPCDVPSSYSTTKCYT